MNFKIKRLLDRLFEKDIFEEDLSSSDRERIKELIKLNKVKISYGSWSGCKWYVLSDRKSKLY